MLRTTWPAIAIALLFLFPHSGTHALAETDASTGTGKNATEDLFPSEAASDEVNVPSAGHSEHGAAYNEGPRQNAYLMGHTGKVNFPVSTTSSKAQRFFDQGLGQLYGFWYYEAERSFRRVVAFDPDCAMGYWGLAMANMENKERGTEFIKEAHAKREHANEHEQMYIDALHAYLTGKGNEKDRRTTYIKALERIIRKYPEDIEAKAMLVEFLWQSSKHGIPIVSHQVVDCMLDEIFRKQPEHPAHHFRIHLWDNEDPAQALSSAAMCGQVAPSIAHMWHMPGHIYSRLHRYHDAIYQQEASARVDHAHMMRDEVLPDQIHNYAHNNEWLIRNLVHVGRANDALDLAKNMLELPQHPKFNDFSMKEMCSCKYGRTRLTQVLETFEMWDELIALSETGYLPPTDIPDLQASRLRLLGVAHYRAGDAAELKKRIEELEEIVTDIDKSVEEAADEAEQKIRDEESKVSSMEKSNDKTAAEEDLSKRSQAKIDKARKKAADQAGKNKKSVEQSLSELRGLQFLARGETDLASEQFQKCNCPKWRMAEYHFLCGKHQESKDLLKRAVESGKNEVWPLAKQVDLQRRMGDREAAKEAFDKLRNVAGRADLETPLLKRLAKFAKELDYPEDWRIAPQPSEDVGVRPELDSLGPLRWAPSRAADWSLAGAEGEEISLESFRGRPVVVIFYLGSGCLHCVEQLHEIAELHDQFAAKGLALIAISSESQEELAASLSSYNANGTFPIPLVSDDQLEVFKSYRCFDDFEEMPLHGTFLIDSQGLIRWRDTSYEPFIEAEFLLQEAERLLSSGG